MSTQFIDIAAAPLVDVDADYLSQQRSRVIAEIDLLRDQRGDLAARVTSIDELIQVWTEIKQTMDRRLNAAVSLLPRTDTGEPEQPLPCEKAAHEAVEQQEAKSGRDPYGPATVPHLPRVNGYVHVDTDGPREADSLVGGVSR